MTGITKIHILNNLGIFDNFTWPAIPENIIFKKINLLYGHNSSGKTTLSNILYLFSEENLEEENENLLNDLKLDPHKTESIHIEWDENLVTSLKEKKKIFVFNSAFIIKHVYNGTQSSIKPFKYDVITQEHLSNPEIIKISNQIESEKKEINNIANLKKTFEKLAESIKLNLSKQWNESIQGARMPSNLNLENMPYQLAQETEKSLEEKLQNNFRRYTLSKDQKNLQSEIESLSALEIQKIKFKNYSPFLLTSVSTKAREKIKNKIDNLKNVKLKHTSHQNWFEDGVNLLKISLLEQQCPLCDNKIEDIDNLLSSYDTYFNGELSVLLQSLEAAILDNQEISGYLNQNDRSASTINNLIMKYNSNNLFTEEDRYVLEFIKKTNIHENINQVSQLLNKKKNDVETKYSEEELLCLTKLETLIQDYNIKLDIIIPLKEKLLEYLRNNTFNINTTKDVCKNLFWLKFNEQGKNIEKEYREKFNSGYFHFNHGGIEFLKFINIRELESTKTIQSLERTRMEKMTQFKQESKYINHFLTRLGVSNFTVDVDPGEDGLKIIYNNGKQKKGIKNSLSEGEKTTLAFAYFLSKYKYEIKDNSQINEKDCIIIIDDPVSSLDENRLYSTALLIRDNFLPKGLKNKDQINWHGCKQIFIFSHNLIFLKFTGNILDKIQNKQRSDFYLENGVLQNLPNGLHNYQTSYFHRLSKIQDFCDGKTNYEFVKDSMPNTIRIVLETFLSFKFARLKGENFSSPGLNKLSDNLRSYNFNDFYSVGNIKDKASLLDAIDQIIKIVDLESHGTPQDLTHFEYLSPSALKNIAAKTINVIQFLDQVHYTAVKKLMDITVYS